jgi:LPXTG-motif cell wall-anchored protein
MALADYGNSAAWQDSADLGFYSESIWVSPVFQPKELPDTGLDAAVAIGLAVAFGLAGVTLVAIRRRA